MSIYGICYNPQKTGIHREALVFIKSYEMGRAMSLLIGGKDITLKNDAKRVPQGSLLRQLLFVIHLMPFHSRLRTLEVNCHIYGEDLLLLISFDCGSPT